MGEEKYTGPDRRKNLRVSYKPSERPHLIVGENKYEVADISEWVLRLSQGDIAFGKWVHGSLTLLCRETVEVKGMVVKKENESIFISLLPHFDKDLLLREYQKIR